jgi:hypothetical protein
MQTLSKNTKQQKSSDCDDLPIFADVIESHEPKDHLHPNYRHWAWLPKPK